MLSRHVQPLLNSLLSQFACVAVLGVRQCGKTTLIRQLPGLWQHFDLENRADRGQILADPDLFFRLHPQAAAIDEAQLAPDIFPALRVAIDSDRARKGRFLLSGSSSPHLSRHIAESLAGRIAYVELAPLTAGEACQLPPPPIISLLAGRADPEAIVSGAVARVDLAALMQHWLHGGYPEPWTSGDATFRRNWPRFYWDSYLLRDIGGLFPQLNRDRFSHFVQMLAHLSGTIINNAEIGRALAVSEPTVRDWLAIAQGTFLWRTVPAWDRSPHKQLMRHGKGYFRDSGLLLRQLQVNDANQLTTHPRQGHFWESYVTEALLRGFSNAGVQVSPFHFRTRGGAEVDLIVDGEFGTIPIEIKFGSATDLRDCRHLAQFVSDHGCAVGLVIDNGERPRRLAEKIVAVPAACL